MINFKAKRLFHDFEFWCSNRFQLHRGRYEAMNRLLKGQVKAIAANDAKAQKTFIENVFSIAA